MQLFATHNSRSCIQAMTLSTTKSVSAYLLGSRLSQLPLAHQSLSLALLLDQLIAAVTQAADFGDRLLLSFVFI